MTPPKGDLPKFMAAKQIKLIAKLEALLPSCGDGGSLN
jgi:hypothetical protein